MSERGWGRDAMSSTMRRGAARRSAARRGAVPDAMPDTMPDAMPNMMRCAAMRCDSSTQKVRR